MTLRPEAERTCPHLPRSLLGKPGDEFWCVQCDGSVTHEGQVIPRGQGESTPPVSRNYGEKLDRFFGQEISVPRFRRSRGRRTPSRST